MTLAVRLKKKLPHFTLDVEFVCPAGKLLAVTGPSGSGKTTVLRMLAGLDDPDTGRITLGDEVDRYPLSAGSEGDPVNLAWKRATAFWNKKRLLCSTPTIKADPANGTGSRIELAFDNSDKRYFFLPCPHCGHKATETMPTDACQYFYDCQGCGTVLKPKAGDCCVYCSYGDVPCPPIQEAHAIGESAACCGVIPCSIRRTIS